MLSPVDLPTSVITSAVRAFAGTMATPAQTQPKKLLKLYDIEVSPYCRLVREVLTELALDAEIYPCPKGGSRYRQEVKTLGGKEQFPFLVDPNTGRQLYESMDIIKYLYRTYGNGELPEKWQRYRLQVASSTLAGVARSRHGGTARSTSSNEPQTDVEGEMIELYSYEHSPYARLVRETLCELEVPYIVRNCGRTRLGEWLPPFIREPAHLIAESELANRIRLQEMEGKVGIPYLSDPITDTRMFESSEIVNYLEQRYAA